MKLRNLTKLVAAMTLVLGASAAQASTIDFDITINFNSGLSASQQAVFTQAEQFWETNILGYNPAEGINFTTGLTISAGGSAIDGAGGVLGQAGPSLAYTGSTNGLYYSSTGQMNFDSADLTAMENNGSLYNVILHEMAHVIGFGTLWELNNLYSSGSGLYTGANALAAYQAEFSGGATSIPVELDGGAGTANAHWDESWLGGTADIMTGYLEGAVTISNTTLAAFEDLGYIVSNASQVEDVSAPIAFGGLLALSMLGFRQRKV
jgi:hypothetical protein